MNSPVPGLLPPHPQLLGSWEEEEKLSTVLSALSTHKPCFPGNKPGRRKTGCTSARLLSHKSFPSPPQQPSTEKKKEELMETPWHLGGIAKWHQSWGRGCKVEKKNKKEYTPSQTKWNERKKYLSVNNRLPSQDSSIIWRPTRRQERELFLRFLIILSGRPQGTSTSRYLPVTSADNCW